MKIGLVHGRFQPFHKGHEFLVNKMLKECDLGVVLIGSAFKSDRKNLFDLESRRKMVRSIFKENKNLLIGANLDLEFPYSKNSQWDVVFSSCVLSLTGYLPTHVYAGDNYSVIWKRIKPKIKKFKRFNNISATHIRKLLEKKSFDKIEKLVPPPVFESIKKYSNR